MKTSKEAKERKIEQEIHKCLSNLQVFLAMYIGEREIERGDTVPLEEVWKKIKEKYAFKLSDKDKYEIKKKIRKITDKNNFYEIDLFNCIFSLLEHRDELFRKKHPKMYPSPYQNHL